MPSVHADISRRRVLLSAAALTVLGVTAAGCGTSAPQPEIDALTAQWDRARTDSALAGEAAAGPGRSPGIAQALAAVAADRTAHAQALSDELTRMGAAPESPATSTAVASPGTTAVPGVDDVVEALRESAEQAARHAAGLSGYRAGLLGSIAASCTAAYTVALGGRP